MSNFGGVDLLVNNTGVFISKSFTDYTAEDYETLLTTNVHRFFNLSQYALRHMAGRGHVVNITTSLAENPLKAVPCVLPILTPRIVMQILDAYVRFRVATDRSARSATFRSNRSVPTLPGEECDTANSRVRERDLLSRRIPYWPRTVPVGQRAHSRADVGQER
jgi:NAD(P)-dependent dehydrogenase (short-subunit alcohol dehydrogenase family)